MAKNIDRENMREVIMQSYNQLNAGLDLAKNIKVDGEFKNVVICGMGGSALPANIIITLANLSIPVYIHRDYNLPSQANKDSLIICISYSGNTEETIWATQEAIKNNFKIIALATGGKLEEIAKQNNIPFAKIPSGIQPRSATGYLFSALAEILANCGIIENISKEILQTSEELKKITQTLEKKGKIISKKIAKKIPVIYSSCNFKAAARIWKIKFNENSKIPAFWNYFPELNHNEMVGYTQAKKIKDLYVLIIKDKDDNERIVKRMALTAAILKKKGVKTEFINTEEGSLMFRFFANILLGDWVSYYTALNAKINPTPVDMVEDFKKKL